jgi:hypothetical protein
MTPFFLGASFGAVASGRVPGGPWFGPTSILVGVLAVACAAFLAAVFLVVDARRTLDEGLESHFRRRAIGSGVATGLIAIVGLFVLRGDAPLVFHGPRARGASVRHHLGDLRHRDDRLARPARPPAARASWQRARWWPSSPAGASPSTRTCCPAR